MPVINAAALSGEADPIAANDPQPEQNP
jgi:hypothetical protein